MIFGLLLHPAERGVGLQIIKFWSVDAFEGECHDPKLGHCSINLKLQKTADDFKHANMDVHHVPGTHSCR